jgi:hypothetical protein
MDKRIQHHQGIEYHGKTHVVIGWREWISLPDFGIKWLKAKIDTGARTSALHAFGIERFRNHRKDLLRFDIHPEQRNEKKTVQCVAEVVDLRLVTDSGGHREHRYVIETPIVLGDICFPIEITLTNRSLMMFRMLLGRKALQDRFIIDPARSYHT